MTNALKFPPCLALTPLREFHIDRGKGRTVAVLYRVAINDHRQPPDDGNQQTRNQRPKARVP